MMGRRPSRLSRVNDFFAPLVDGISAGQLRQACFLLVDLGDDLWPPLVVQVFHPPRPFLVADTLFMRIVRSVFEIQVTPVVAVFRDVSVLIGGEPIRVLA